MSTPLSPSNKKHPIEITQQELIWHEFLPCPLQDKPLWNAHPRVYLPIIKSGHVTCPYCGTSYLLKDKKKIPIKPD